MDIIREATIGQLIRWITRNRVLRYPEELPGFQCPLCYNVTEGQDTDPETTTTSPKPEAAGKEAAVMGRRQSLARVGMGTALQKSCTRAELEQRFADACHADSTSSVDSIAPEKLQCGTIVVDWYSTDDPANPQNWSMKKKIFVSAII
jgi:DHA1 family multidrug resistance protein-like MFS transporter